MADAVSIPASQDTVFTPIKKHGLYLWIYIKPTFLDVNALAKKIVTDLPGLVVAVNDLNPPNTPVEAGVGFGLTFYKVRMGKTTTLDYPYPFRTGETGDLPSTGGDIFIHAKCDDFGKLFQLCRTIMVSFPAGSVLSFEDIYGFPNQEPGPQQPGRDLSGFIDGTENPSGTKKRQQVAVEKSTGGSYAVTQKWVHDFKVIDDFRENNLNILEAWVGRTLQTGAEIPNKRTRAHIARMTGGTNMNNTKRFEIVRQSLPYGDLHNKAGLFFLAYAESPANIDFMLNWMVGQTSDKVPDDILLMTRCVTGTLFYFPGKPELEKLK